MNLEEVKDVIRSLLASSNTECTLQRLLTDFYNETGFKMPTFKYSNEKKFLMSLTDTVKVRGKLNEEKVVLVKGQKSSHITSLVQRQGKTQRCVKQPNSQNSNPLTDTPSDNRTSGGTNKSNRKNESGKTRDEQSKPNLLCKKNLYKSNDEVRICEGKTNDNKKCGRGNNIGGTDFIFEENEAAKLDPKMFTPNSGNHPFLRSQNSCTNSETDSGGVSSSTHNSSSNQTTWIPDKVKEKLKRLISCQTHGIWCCELPDLYNELYNSQLDYKEYGFRSLIEMILLLSDIFRCVRPGNEDWLVFDASKPLPEEEMAIHSVSECQIPPDIENNVMKLLEYHLEKSGKHDIEVGDFLILYFVKYGVKLEFREYGFRNVKDFMNRLCSRGFKIETEDNKLFIKSISANPMISDDVESAIKPDDKLFPELFPDDVVRFGEKFTVLDLEKCFKIGEMVDVVVADIWSPTKFFVQLKSYENDFKSLMKNLLEFYNEDKPKYRMPRATLLPGQVCVAFNEPENATYSEKFYRSTIIRANKKKVKVHFIDYGMDCKVNFEDVRFLHRSFFDLPAQGFAAKLSNVSPAFTKTWPSDANERFLDLVSVPKATFLIDGLDLENKIVSGTLFTKVKKVQENVGMILIKEGMAFPKKNDPCKRVYVPEDDLEEAKDENHVGNPSVPLNDNDKKTRGGSGEKFSNDEGGGIAPESTETEKADTIDSAVDFPLATDTPENKLSLERENRLRLSWTMGKEIEALAFSLLSGDQWIRGIARVNFDFGVDYAKALAERILIYSEMALPQ